VDDLLRLSRISRHEVKKTHFDLGRVVRSCIEALRIECDFSRVTLRIDAHMPVYGDEALLEIALFQLVANALKFSAQVEAPCVEVTATDAGAERVYRVRDNGTGFDMKYADKLFVPFQRLHPEAEFPGSGIGLVTVQRIVARHGGRVWADAKPDEGATFYFSLCQAAITS
jgi:light-regulated signal transduction histidine kinase (bacteriophytochrome)